MPPAPSIAECIAILRELAASAGRIADSEEIALRVAGQRIVDIAEAQLGNYDFPDLSEPLD